MNANRLKFLVLAGALVASLAPAASAGEISGRVIDAVTGKPIARARIVVKPEKADEIVMSTDDQGAFRVRQLPAGRVNIHAFRAGYLNRPELVAAGDWSVQITILESMTEATARLNLRLTPQAVIEGQTVDGKGRTGGVLVRLWKQAPGAPPGVQQAIRVDRTGEFRFAGLGAGRYYLEVSSWPSNSPAEVYPLWQHRFYKEGLAVANATPIDLQPGQVEKIAIALEPTQGYRVRGQVAAAPADVSVSLHLSDESVQVASGSWDYQTRTFTVSRVPPGTYVIRANWNIDGKASSALLPITISDHDLDGIVLSPSEK